jgi:L-arabinose isomerase
VTTRVALLVPFWEFWESSARGDLRAHLRELAQRVPAALPAVEVVARELLLSAEEAPAVAARLRAAAPDVLLVVQVMAVPPARTMAVLDTLPELPLVVWALHERASVDDRFDHSDITTEGATVGTSQLANLLVRRPRPFALRVGRLGDPVAESGVTAALRVAGAARAIATATLARVGAPPPGYDCVTCDPATLTAALGLRVLDVAPAELAEAFARADEAAVTRVQAEVEREFDGAPVGEGMQRSLRFAAALEQFGRQRGIDAGALNCHVPELRFSSAVGIAPCFALGRETTRGVPWACAGDLLTAVALLTTKRLGGAALYHELETIDYERDELVIANTGEHDLAWFDPAEWPRLVPNGWFAGNPIQGVCACASPPPGPATLVAFTPHPGEPGGFRYIVAEGEFGARRFRGAATPNGAFRFRGLAAPDGYRAWALAGANHHSSSTPGHLGDAVAELAALLGVGVVRVSRDSASDPI